MATYTVTDGNGRESGLSWDEACESIEGWYADVACWATGEASDDEMDAVASAIDSVPQPEEATGLAGLEQYVSAICDAVAAALGYGAVAGHGNYYVSAADRAGLDLRVVGETRRYRVYAATTEHGGVQGLGQGDEYYEAFTAAEAARMAADDWVWDADDWDGGDVIVATDDNGDSYHLHRD